MTRKADLTGKRFSRLVAISESGRTKGGMVLWRCRCDCGNEKVVVGKDLKRGHTESCGCLRVERAREAVSTHGHTQGGSSKLYRIWAGMKHRCMNPKNKNWDRYGGRGIRVCDQWLKFDGFLRDMGPSFPGPGWTIERVDNDGNYEPSNCAWIPYFRQMANTCNSKRIRIGDEEHNLADWCKRHGIAYHMALYRLKAGWPANLALTLPRYARPS